jgi:hydrogenase/urease accessory protein HupE
VGELAQGDGRDGERNESVKRMRGLAVLIFGIVASVLRAHDPGISTAQGNFRDGRLELTVGFAPSDAQQLLPPEARSGTKWTQAEFETAKSALEALAPQLWELRVDDTVVPPSETSVHLAAGDSLNFRLVYPCPPDRPLTLRALKLGGLPPGHREFLILSDDRGSTVAKKLLNAKDDTIAVGGAGENSAAAEEPPPTFVGFLKLGVEHIWTGYDHMLFLFALLIVCRSFRSIVSIISCFTLAHSLTLALATMNVINLPSRLVEPAIAASIVFVGAENLARRGAEPRGRSLLTFAFGLIHGFGFASVLRDLGVGTGSQGIAMPLFTFNLGVEVGQIAVAAVVLPIVWQLRKNKTFVQRGVPALSAIVTVAGLYWLLERTVLA